MQNTAADNFINDFNQTLAKTYADFSLALDKVENLFNTEEKYLVTEKIQQIDNLYQSIIKIMRPHVQRAAERRAINLGDTVYCIYPHYDCAGAYLAGWAVNPETYTVKAIINTAEKDRQKQTYLLTGNKNDIKSFLPASFEAAEDEIFPNFEQAKAECVRRNEEESRHV